MCIEYWCYANPYFILWKGGELFAKRRKKADKWVVDESQIGMGEHPSLFADEFITQQNMAQQQMHEEKTMEIREKQQIKGTYILGLL